MREFFSLIRSHLDEALRFLRQTSENSRPSDEALERAEYASNRVCGYATILANDATLSARERSTLIAVAFEAHVAHERIVRGELEEATDVLCNASEAFAKIEDEGKA